MNFIQCVLAGAISFALARSSLAQPPGAAQGSGAIKEAHQSLSLNGAWTVTAMPLETEGETGYKNFSETNAERLPAQVPGEVHLDLIRLGRMPDPDISDNAREHCRWPEDHSWWYRTGFTPPPGFLKNLRQQIVFEGIDLC